MPDRRAGRVPCARETGRGKEPRPRLLRVRRPKMEEEPESRAKEAR
jgi:hypothetical protein